MRVLSRSTWRHSLRHPWQLALSLLGVALGVAVVVAIDLANDSARRAFELSREAVLGRTSHTLVAGSLGIPEALYARLRVELGIDRAAPVVEGAGATPGPGGRSVTLLGLDPFAEAGFRDLLEAAVVSGAGSAGGAGVARLLVRPGTVLATPGTARALGVAPGERFRLIAGGRERQLVLAGLLEAPDALARSSLDQVLVGDIAAVQEILDLGGRLTRVDLILPAGPQGAAQAARLREALPPGVRLVTAAARTRTVLEMSAAFSLNLTMLSLLALVVGAFLIYNTMTFSVVRRRALLGSLRTLGATRGQIARLVLVEAGVIGLAGGLAGVALGVLLAEGFLALMTRTINDLYYSLTVSRLALDPLNLGKGLVLGVGTALLAAWVPAREAAAVPPRVALSRADLEAKVRRLVPGATAAGVLLLAASGILLNVPGGGLGAGFAALFALVFGYTLLIPGGFLAAMRLGGPLAGRVAGTLGPLAARGLAAGLSRTAVAVAALTVAVATTVGVGVMVDSFRTTVSQWLEDRLQADVYVSLPVPGARFEPATVAALRTLPGVREASTGLTLELETAAGPLDLFVLEPAADSLRGFRLLAGDEARARARFRGADAVLISEPLASRRELVPGDDLQLPAPGGPRRFKVVGIYADYGSDQGVVTMSRRTFQRHWDEPGASAVGLYLAPGVAVEAVARAVREVVPADRTPLVRANAALREASLEVFDRTFTITVVLRMLAALVAFVGVVSALTALQLERQREMAVLRALGLTRAQVWALVSGQTGLMGLVAGLLALPLGLGMALILILVVNRRSFGWTLEVHVDPLILAQALGLALVAALLAGLQPAWRMSRAAPADALRAD